MELPGGVWHQASREAAGTAQLLIELVVVWKRGGEGGGDHQPASIRLDGAGNKGQGPLFCLLSCWPGLHCS